MLAQKSRRFPWQLWLKPWLKLDPILVILPTALTLLGGLLIRSAEMHQGWTDWLQHWVMGGVGLALALALARCRYEALLHLHWFVYGLINASLIAVMALGTAALGAQRWITILGFNVQPSEFAKVGLILTLAAVLHQKPASTIPGVVRALLIAAPPWILVFLQPDLGTSLVFGAITLGMIYWANANLGWIVLMFSPLVSALMLNVPLPGNLNWILGGTWVAAMGLVAWLTLPVKKLGAKVKYRLTGAIVAVAINLSASALGRFLWGILKDYQKDRLILFLDPDKDPLGGGYHLIQSRIAIGAGGLWGRGLNQGTQTQLNFIPEQHTDFIFSAVGEELGLVGGLLILLAFWLICVRLVVIARTANEDFGSLLAMGVFWMVLFQVIINVGMTIGLAPVTGIPLPWLSYGRSALLTNFIAIGLVESVVQCRKKRHY
ncbi:rod shape-determining protein RodA [Synechococcales cyanobacterium C]|uniref:Peptidoglycan glycosyltransferase RodA n=2 Tax=Petrachloros TaxID=2918834 RepID=A0A8K2A8W7_9CYAN|nr:rod shape-determining protein RodA [Petrachloros mirabilis]NCJ07629.1 rod shape-determining protein RodA [Petrachloros mirabilis ULC683]